MARKSLKTDKQKDRKIRCIYCDKPIHIDNFAGIFKKGFICGNSVCLMKLAQDCEHEERVSKARESIKRLRRRNL